VVVVLLSVSFTKWVVVSMAVVLVVVVELRRGGGTNVMQLPIAGVILLTIKATILMRRGTATGAATTTRSITQGL